MYEFPFVPYIIILLLYNINLLGTRVKKQYNLTKIWG